MDLSPGVFVAGRYEIATLLGAGAFGIVLRVRDRQGRSFALKLLTNEKHDGRFAREVEVVRQLSHPNIVRLVDSGAHEGLPFVVFELVQGQTLASLLARGPMPIDRVVVIVRQLLHALGTAHAMRLVHRDLKPANVMIVGDQVKLLDFGVARSLDPEATNLTAMGEIIGTPQYMSPEQVASIPVDASTDLYALGLVASEMLSGRPVYDGAVARVFARLASPERTPIPEDVLGSPLGQTIARATEKSPAARFRSAREMLESLPQIEPPAPAPKSFIATILVLTMIGICVVGAGLALLVVARRPAAGDPPHIESPALPSRNDRPMPASEEKPSHTHQAEHDAVKENMVNAGFTIEKDYLYPGHYELTARMKHGDGTIHKGVLVQVITDWFRTAAEAEAARVYAKKTNTPTQEVWIIGDAFIAIYSDDPVGLTWTRRAVGAQR